MQESPSPSPAPGLSATAPPAATAEDLDPVRVGLLFATLLFPIEEGIVTAFLSWRGGAPMWVSLAAGGYAAGFLFFPVALLALPIGLALRTNGARVLARHLRVGLGGDRPEHEGVGVVLYSIVLACGAGASWRLGFRVADFQSVQIATLATMLSSVAVTLGGALLVAMVVRPVGLVVRRVTSRAPSMRWLAWIPIEGLLVATVATLTLLVLLPADYVNSPAAAFIGYALGPSLARRVRALGRLARIRVRWLLVAALAVSMGVGAFLGRASAPVRLGVLSRAPFAAIAVTTLRRVVDRDHDGYSPILGGGDCDDSNPSIHPGAINVPDNGVDEDCSGVDARPYHPPIQDYKRPSRPTRDNVVLIHFDALRPDHVGFVGYGRPTTPRIDRFRKGATWFKNAYTPAPTTRFALASLMTGREIARLPTHPSSGNDFALLPEAVTLAERLEPAGYDRVGYTLSFVLGHIHGVGQGFRVWETPWPLEDWEATRADSASMTSQAAITYLATMPEDGSKPYFLFLHYDCTHDPYVKHKAWDYGDSAMDKYDSALSYCDDELGTLFDRLDARRDRDRTAIILYSDHGELFGEHGFKNHGNTLFDPDIRVLLLARVPGSTVDMIDAPTVLTDIFPTLLELTGLPPDPESQAWNLAPYLLRGQSMPGRSLYLYADLWHGLVHSESRGVIKADGRLKFIRDLSVGLNRLYDRKADPAERSDLADDDPTTTRSLEAQVEGWEAFERTP